VTHFLQELLVASDTEAAAVGFHAVTLAAGRRCGLIPVKRAAYPGR
jgi:hypothetical protein